MARAAGVGSFGDGEILGEGAPWRRSSRVMMSQSTTGWISDVSWMAGSAKVIGHTHGLTVR